MQTFKRICIKDWEITAQNGDHFSVARGEEYITSPVREGSVVVFGRYWVPVPVEHFAGEQQFTNA